MSRHLQTNGCADERMLATFVGGTLESSARRRVIEHMARCADGRKHFGTGLLVGHSYVLTAAHLFFERDGKIIDRSWVSRIAVEAHTTLCGNAIAEGKPRSVALETSSADSWLVDPPIEGETTPRDVNSLDFVIVRLAERLGDQQIGRNRTRGWFDIPTARDAPVLASDVGIRVFQFLDREVLRTSYGWVRDVTPDGYRVLHTASTADSASGAPILDANSRLVALHLGGSTSGERPKSNRGLPIRRVAEEIDKVRPDRPTVRSLLT